MKAAFDKSFLVLLKAIHKYLMEVNFMPRRKIAPPEEGHVVMEFKSGNTTLRICDDYCRDKTPEQVDAILDRIAKNAYRHLYAQEMQKRAKERTETKAQ